MRSVLAFVMLLVFVPALHADDGAALTADKPAVEQAEKVVTPDIQFDNGLEIEPILTQQHTSAPANTAAVAAQPDRVTWWWLLAAIVIGGVLVVALT